MLLTDEGGGGLLLIFGSQQHTLYTYDKIYGLRRITDAQVIHGQMAVLNPARNQGKSSWDTLLYSTSPVIF
jgi:hypothetical protein